MTTVIHMVKPHLDGGPGSGLKGGGKRKSSERRKKLRPSTGSGSGRREKEKREGRFQAIKAATKTAESLRRK